MINPFRWVGYWVVKKATFDQILVIQAGQVAERGRHEAQQGLHHQLWQGALPPLGGETIT